MKADPRLLPIAIVILAGAIALGLGQVALGTSRRDSFPVALGGGTMVIGLFVFVVLLIKSSQDPRE